MRSTPGTIRKNSTEIFPQTDRSCDGKDTDLYMQPEVNMSLEQPDLTPTNPCSSKYDLGHNQKPVFKDDYRYCICPTTIYGTHMYTFRKSSEHVLEPICGKPTSSFKPLAVFLKQLLSTTDRNIPILEFADTGNRIFITTL